jgi:hypothetical protein
MKSFALALLATCAVATSKNTITVNAITGADGSKTATCGYVFEASVSSVAELNTGNDGDRTYTTVSTETNTCKYSEAYDSDSET